MATTITVTCPECEKQIQAPAAIAGKKIRCKSCGHVFVARAGGEAIRAAPPPAGKPAAKAKPPENEDEDDGAKAYGVTDLDLAPRCPHCANEMESAEAIICLHCGYNTQTRERARTRKVHDVTGGEQFLWLLPGILCVLAVLLLIGNMVSSIIYWNNYVGEGEFAKYKGQAVSCCTLWWCLGSIWVGYKATRFAINRLILHPTPPEREEQG
jgi:predicted Zn finger-like uncharacterized protein